MILDTSGRGMMYYDRGPSKDILSSYVLTTPIRDMRVGSFVHRVYLGFDLL